MAVEKMYFINAAGPLKELDSFVMNYLAKSEIQLINSTSVVKAGIGLIAFDERNPYEGLVKKITGLCKEMNIDTSEIDIDVYESIDATKAEGELNALSGQFDCLTTSKKELSVLREHKETLRRQILYIQNLNIEVDKFFNFKFMKFRFGKMPFESFEKMGKLNEKFELILYEVYRDGDDVYLVYFMPRMVQVEIDELFNSLSFTRIRISDEVRGFPKEALIHIETELQRINDEIAIIEEKINQFQKDYKVKVSDFYGVVNKLSYIFSVRQFAAHTKEVFYINGWVPESKLEAFVTKVRKSKIITVIVDEAEDKKQFTPPTKLKNNSFFKPFETFIAMYGIPSYKEMDPTVFVGITYILMFGMMFGDLGQGLIIALLGLFAYKKFKSSLAHIAIYLGVSSMVSGIFNGSFFGNEEFLREHLSFIPMIHSMDHQSEILITAIGFGVVLILTAMGINVYNAVKSKKIGRLLFDRNGVVGIVLYFAILYYVIVKVMALETPLYPAIMLIVLSIVIIFLSHPLQKLIEGKKDFMPSDKKGYIIEAFFELIETLLAILSNSISFIRVGAFALNHVGFFMAFKMLSEMVEKTAGSTGGVAVLIFGNILIIVLEGFIVGIQCLRLEYYELFSRFFTGEGIEFKPFISLKTNDTNGGK